MEFILKGWPQTVVVQWLGQDDELGQFEADAYFDLLFSNEFISAGEFIKQKTVFVNAVCCTAAETGMANYIRMNAWPSFLQRGTVEIAGGDHASRKQAEAVLNTLAWKYVWVPDQPGMISARIISMVINEAYFALGDGISTRGEIDTAMKLGTNYPYGPFEWGQKIGIENVYYLLKKLQQQDANRYELAPLLAQEALNDGLIA